MSSSLALRHVRHLSTAAASKPVSISYTKSRLKNVHDPDEALKIYTGFIDANHSSTSPASTRHALENTVRCLAKSHRFSDIESLLESHKSQPQVTDEAFLSSIIRSYGVAGMLENAVGTYEQMTELGTPRSTLSFNSLISACVHTKVFDRVPVYFNEFPAKFGFSPDKFSYGMLIKSYSEMGEPAVAMEKLTEMEEKGIDVDPIVFSTILYSLYKKDMVDEAEMYWNEMVNKKGLKPDTGSYNVRLFHIHHGDPVAVKALIDEMIAAGIKPDAISYNYLMTSYCESGMLDEATEVYDELLKAKGCNPNAATFRTLIFFMCKQGRYVSGYKVFKESVKVRKIPDFNTLKYLAEGLAKTGRKSDAKSMFRTMKKKFPPTLLKAWTKLADDLGLASVATEQVDSGEKVKASTID